jgi:cob(I)alamin adenosyltransferase
MTDSKSCLSGVRQGLITIFTGDGRGKTSAAIGTAVRAAGHGLRVCLVFFMKGDLFPHGEMLALANISGITLAAFGQDGWVKREEDNPEHRVQALQAMDYACSAMNSGNFDLIILDEVLSATDWSLLTLSEVVSLLAQKPYNVDLILTGRNAPAELIALADVVTEMQCIKHPFDRGIQARAGIDY